MTGSPAKREGHATRGGHPRRDGVRGTRVWGMPWWVAVIVVWLIGRSVSTAMLLFYAANQAENAWTGKSPSLFDFSSLWDGRWYNIIAVTGYPTELPLTDDGRVGENAWAFMPVFPLLARTLMVFGLDWNTAGITISLLAGLGASFFFYRLVARYTPSSQAIFAVLLFGLAPTAPLLQVAYGESLQMFFIAVTLFYLSHHRYSLVLIFGTVLAFTRPGAIALALVVVIHGVTRYAKRRTQRFPVNERIAASMTAGWLTVVGFAWPVVAALATGRPSAYFETELAWRSVYIGYLELVPFTPWIQGMQWWTTQQWGWPPEPWGYVLLGGVVVVAGLILVLPAARRVGPEIRLWSLSYGLYVLAVFFPQSSTFRILAPLFPALAIVAAPRSRIYRILIVTLFVVGQFLWIGAAWAVSDYDWTPP